MRVSLCVGYDDILAMYELYVTKAGWFEDEELFKSTTVASITTIGTTIASSTVEITTSPGTTTSADQGEDWDYQSDQSYADDHPGKTVASH